MGALTNNSRKLANFAGFYKGIQSAGAAGMWRLDALKTPFMTEFATCWGLLGGSLLIASPVIFTKIKDQSDMAADLEFSDETAGEVAGIQMQEKGDSDSKNTGEYDSGSQDNNKSGGDDQEVFETVGQGNTESEHR